MKRIIVSASAIAMLAGVLSLTRDAFSEPGNQPAAAANAPHKVGLIDMAFVFKNYKKFETLREDLKAKITESEDKAKGAQQEILDLQTKIKTYAEGSPDFSKTEQALVQKAADFETFKRKMGREFLKEEAQIYQQVYNEVLDAVKFFAEKKEYTLIMRFNREDMENENQTPQAMLQNMNRQVVYHREDDDITQSILRLLNNKFDKADRENRNAAPAGTTPPAVKAPRQAAPQDGEKRPTDKKTR